ncbi:MAG TPA: hypothetical protein VJ990_05075 [Clostridia bacterium]|nr:hypothetical protein [Clostridia bacterium]
MVQFEFLIENLNSQTNLYRSLKPVMEGIREGSEKSPEEMLEVLRRSQDTIDSVSRLADERRVMEKHLSEMLGLEIFERISLEGCVKNALLGSFDEAVSNLTEAIEDIMDSQKSVIDAARGKKTVIGERLKETSKGKMNIKTYYAKVSDACFIDEKSK